MADPKEDRVLTRGGEAPDFDQTADAAEAGSVPDAQQTREDELLDEGLEETFPASDPVAAKHIT